MLFPIGPVRYLSIAGRGDPAGTHFATKMGALYAMAFALKMASKKAGRDYKVCKLEGLWWGSPGVTDMMTEPPAQWNWKLLIRTPDFITDTQRKMTISDLLAKEKPGEVGEVHLETLNEGPSVQMLHVGRYTEERPTIDQMREFAAGQGLSFHGLHHEIYLSDPRRVAPEKLRTILRHPVR